MSQHRTTSPGTRGLLALLLVLILHIHATNAQSARLTLVRDCSPLPSCSDLVQSSSQVVAFKVIANQTLAAQALVTIKIVALDSAQPVSSDFFPTEAVMALAAGQTEFRRTFAVQADSTPQLRERFRFDLIVASGQVVADPASANVTVAIAEHDDPYGVFQLSNIDPQPIEELDGADNVASFTIIRTRGLFADQVVSWEAIWAAPPTPLSALSSQISVTSGQATFNSGVSSQSFQLSVLHDTIPELAQLFSVSLISVSGGARFNATLSTVIITIPTNDDANGVFSMQARSIDISESATSAVVSVTRTRGVYGTVSVSWSLLPPSSQSLTLLAASSGSDYVPQSGIVTFKEGDSSKSFTVFISDDEIPETSEYLVISLDSSSIAGGARLNDQRDLTYTLVRIPPNDNAGGIFSIQADPASASIDVPKAQGTTTPARFWVTRSAGQFGNVQLAWQANVPLTSNQTISPYVGTLVLEEGKSSAFIQVDVNPYAVASLDIVLEVKLVSLISEIAGQAVINSSASSASVIIKEHDDPYGVVGFATPLTITVPEPDLNNSKVSITLVKTAGLYNATVVQWQITGPSLNISFAYTQGSVRFAPGQSSVAFDLYFVPNDIPEFAKLFNVTLYGNTIGRIDSSRSALQVTIPTNDQPFGLFQVDKVQYIAAEPMSLFSTLDITVLRTKSQLGSASVKIKTETSKSSDQTTIATSDVDFVSFVDILSFGPGENSTTYTVYILGDDLSECDEGFLVTLFDARDQEGLDTSGHVGIVSPAQTEITISINDNGNGIFQFSDATKNPSYQVVMEPIALPSWMSLDFPVTRTSGLCGTMTVGWSLAPISPLPTDFTPQNGVISFSAGVSDANISLVLFNDQLPEPDRLYSLTLVNVTHGIAGQSGINAKSKSTNFTILANDPISIQLASTEQRVGISDGFVRVSMIRTGGLDAQVSITLTAFEYQSANASSIPFRARNQTDFIGGVFTIKFEANQTASYHDIPIPFNSNPEFDKIFAVGLSNISYALYPSTAKIGANSMSLITVAEHDYPRGLLQFSATSLTVKEGTSFVIPIVRTRGLSGAVSVQVQVQDGTAIGGDADFKLAEVQVGVMNSAGNSSYVASFADASATTFAQLLIINADSIPELAESFIVSLTTTMGNPAVGANSTLKVVIEQNDYANGRVAFGTAQSTIGALVTKDAVETEIGTVVSFPLTRRAGLFGDVRVLWHVDPAVASRVSPTSGSVLLPEGVDTSAIFVTVVSNDIPEDTTSVAIMLASITGGAELFSNATVAFLSIAPNDNAFGVFSLDPLIAPLWLTNSTTRQIQIPILRAAGAYRAVTISAAISFAATSLDICGHSDAFASSVSLTFAANETSKAFVVDIPAAEYLSADAHFCVFLNTAVLANGQVLQLVDGPSPIISQNAGDFTSTEISVPALAATGIVELLNSSLSTSEGSDFTLTVRRSEGLFSTLNIPVAYVPVVLSNNQTDASLDFSLSPATFHLAHGRSEADILVSVIDDDEPELDEFITMTLDSSHSAGFVRFSPIATSVDVYTELSDAPFGRFEFSQPDFPVLRATGTVFVSVIRRSAYQRVTVKLTTETSSANGDTAQAGIDYVPLSTIVVLEEGQYSASVAIGVLPSATDIPIATFTAVLSDATNGALIGALNRTTISVQTCVGCLVGFNESNLVVIPQPVGAVQLYNITLSRTPYNFGVTEVFWNLTGNDAAINFDQLSGSVSLDFYEKYAVIVLAVKRNFVPSFATNYTLQLSSSTGETMLDGARSSLELNVLSHDQPYGLFQFSVANVLIYESEGTNSTVAIQIDRLGGSVGTVVATYSVTGDALSFYKPIGARLGTGVVVTTLLNLASTSDCAFACLQRISSAPSCQAFDFSAGASSTCILRASTGVTASPASFQHYDLSTVGSHPTNAIRDLDFATPYQFSVTFTAGSTSQMIPVTVLPDFIPELSKSFTFTLTKVTVIDPVLSIQPLPTELVLGSIATCTITIPENDDPRGVFALESLNVNTVEGSTLQIKVIRAIDTYGSVNVSWILNGTSASPGVDTNTTSGFLSFADGQVDATIFIGIVDDAIPEIAETMTLSLNSNLGRIDEGLSQAVITIAENDDPHGILQFSTPSVGPNAWAVGSGNSSRLIKLVVERTAGLFGSVSVAWTLASNASSLPVPLSSLVTPINGAITLIAGQNSTSIDLSLMDNTVPQFITFFTVTLSNPTGSAKLNAAAVKAQFAIQEHDEPKGVLSFAVPSMVNREMNTIVRVQVIRTQGAYGTVSVSYTTKDGTAIGRGATRKYADAAGVVTMTDGQRSATISITLIDDAIAQPALNFSVVFTVGTNTTTLGLSQMVMTIEASDDGGEYGYFNFNPTSVLVPEQANRSSSIATFIRTGGLHGNVLLNYTAQSANMLRYSYSAGVAQLPVNVYSSQKSLVNTSVLCAAACSNLTFSACRAFVYSASQKNCSLYSVAQSLRALAAGDAADSMYFARVDGVEASFGLPQQNFAAISSAQVLFADGQSVATVQLPILDNTLAELPKLFNMELTSVALIGSPQSIGATGPQVGLLTELEVIIDANDGVFGTISFSDESNQLLQESIGRVQFNLTRTFSSIGAFKVWWTLTPSSPASGDVSRDLDAATLSGVISFAEGQSRAALSVVILDDSEPELQESFVLTLSSSDAPLTAVFLGSPIMFTIAESDVPGGSVFLQSAQAFPYLLRPGQSQQLIIARDGAALKDAAVIWNVQGGTDALKLRENFESTNGTIVIAAGQQSVHFNLTTIIVAQPQLNQDFVFTIELAAQTTGTDLVSSSSSQAIRILAFDHPHGILYFEQPEITVDEPESGVTRADFVLVRGAGAFGQVNVTVEFGPIRNMSAAYSSVTLDTVECSFAEGDSICHFIVSVESDNIPEMNEVFTLRITNVTGGADLATEDSTAKLTIRANDEPHGLFSVSCDRTWPCSTAPEGSTSNFVIERKQGTFGSVVVYWKAVVTLNHYFEVSSDANAYYHRTNDSYTPTPSQFEHTIANSSEISAYEGQVVFSGTMSQAMINLTITADGIPEYAEGFFVELYSLEFIDTIAAKAPRSPRIDASKAIVPVIIPENDDARGVIVFAGGAITVSEDQPGTLNVTILRTGGSLSAISVSLDVLSLGVTLTGMQQDASVFPRTIDFQDGQQTAVVSILVMNDDLPEIDEAFEVVIANVSVGASIGSNHAINVTILANDTPYGLFSIHSTSTFSTRFAEGDLLTFNVLRARGQFNQQNVSWSVGPSINKNDVSPSSGVVTFAENQAEVNFTITIVNDSLPELESEYTISLDSISGGGLIDSLASIIKIDINGSDYPFGLFEFAPTSRNITVSEINATIPLVISRRQGTHGRVQLYFQASIPTGWALDNTASIGSDFAIANLSVIFEDGDASAFVSVQVVDDSIPELVEFIQVRLISVQLLSGFMNYSGAPSLASSGLDALIAITENDTPYGILSLGPTPLSVSEDAREVSLTVTRSAGAFGSVSVLVSTQADTANGTFGFSSLSTASQQNISDVRAETVRLIQDSTGQTFMVAASMQLDTNVYRFNAGSNSFEFLQKMTGKRSRSAAFFNIGSVVYLVVAVWREDVALGNSYTSTSQLFRLNSVSQRFDLVQGIVTTGAISCKPFTLFGEHYLAIAQYTNDAGSFNVGTQVLRWNAASQQFDLLAVLPSLAAFDVDFALVANEGMLAISNYQSSSTNFAVDSFVYRWNNATSSFVSLQRLPASASTSVAFFSAHSRTYLVLASHKITPKAGIDVFNVSSALYQWNSIARSFDLIQTIPTCGAYDVAAFDILGEQFITVANFNSDTTGALTTSDVYHFIAPSSQLEHVHSINTNGARSIATFQLNQKTYLTVGNRIPGSNLEVRQVAVPNLNADFGAVSSIVTFAAGETSKVVAITLIDDSIGEPVETFNVTLSAPSGGAALAQAVQVVSIRANDDYYGQIGFSSATLSQALTFDEPAIGMAMVQIPLVVQRNISSAQAVNVSWNIPSPLSNSVTPTSGLLVFAAGQNQTTLLLTVVDDNLPEFAQKFSVQLIGGIDGARFDSNSSSIWITINANDQPFGGVGFASTQAVTVAENEDSALPVPVSFRVMRQADALLVPLTVNYSIVSIAPSPRDGYAMDITPLAGSITFDASGTYQEQLFTVMIASDMVPELQETFQVNLEVANTAQVPLVRANAAVSIIIPESNNPHGALSFATNLSLATQSATNRSIILRASRNSTYGVVRALITIGYAQSSTAAPQFNASILPSNVASIVFQDNSASASVVYTLQPNARLDVGGVIVATVSSYELLDATSGIVVSQLQLASGLSANTTIPSNSASGFLTLSDSSVSNTIIEGGAGEASKTVTLTVLRFLGTFGRETVQWNIAGAGQDLTPSSGLLAFEDGDTSKSFTITVNNDNTPELDETFNVTLVAQTFGTLLIKSTATIAVPANDDVFGQVRFAALAPVQFVSNNSNGYMRYLEISVERVLSTVGDALLTYSIFYATPAQVVAGNIGSKDASKIAIGGTITFPTGTGAKSVNISLPLTSAVLQGSKLTVRLDKVEMLPGQPQSLLSNLTVALAGNTDASALVDIDVYSMGTFDLAVTNVVVSEDIGSASISVRRLIGSSGAVTLQYAVSSVTATLGLDIGESTQGLVVFGTGVTERTLLIPIVNDDIPESDETFSIRLTDISGGGLLEGNLEVVVTISANDNASGLISFASSSLLVNVSRPASLASQNYQLQVTRQAGLLGDLNVSWTAQGDGLTAADISPLSGSLTLADGVSTTTIVYTLFANSTPSLRRSLTFRLTSVVGGIAGQTQLDAVNSTSIVTILASNDPYGVFSFVNSTILQDLQLSSTGRRLRFTINRAAGSFEAVSVGIQINSSLSNSAQVLNACALPLTLGTACLYTATVAAGSASDIVTLAVSNAASIPSSVQFSIRLASVSVVGAFAAEAPPRISNGTSVLNISTGLSASDGLVAIAAASKSILISPLSVGIKDIHITVERTGGLYVLAGSGIISVAWAVTQGAANIENSIAGPYEGTITFAVGVKSAVISLTQIADLEPSFNTPFTVSILSVMHCANISEIGCVAAGTRVASDSMSSALVLQARNDPIGAFGFGSALAIKASGKPLTVNATIVRFGGSSGISRVHYVAFQDTYDTYFISKSEMLIFADGETSKSISLAVTSLAATSNFTIILNGTIVELGGARVDTALSKLRAYVPAIVVDSSSDGTHVQAGIGASFTGSPKDVCIDYSVDKCVGFANQEYVNTLGLVDIAACLTELNTLAASRLSLCGDSSNQVQGILLSIVEYFSLNAYPAVGDYQSRIGVVMDNILQAPHNNAAFALVMERLAYSLLSDCTELDSSMLCSCCCQRVLTGMQSFSMEVARDMIDTLSSTSFPSGADSPSDQLTMPSALRRTFAFQDRDTSTCDDVHFIKYTSSAIFTPADSTRHVLSSVILAAGFDGAEVDSLPSDNLMSFTVTFDEYLREPECSWWNFEMNDWSTTGCEKVSSTGSSMTCECSHFTNFAVTTLKTYHFPFHFLAGLLFVMLMCIAILIFFMCAPKQFRQSTEGRIAINVIVALFVLHLFFLVNLFAARYDHTTSGRYAVGLLLHFAAMGCAFSLLAATIGLLDRLMLRPIAGADIHGQGKRRWAFVLAPWMAAVIVVGLYIAFASASSSAPSEVYADLFNTGRIIFLNDFGGFVGAFLVLAVVSAALQLAFMIKGAAQISRLSPDTLALIPEQEMAVLQSRMLYVITTWAILPFLVGTLSAFYTPVALEYLFTLVDVVLAVLLIWYLISQISLRKRSADLSGSAFSSGSQRKYDPSSNKYRLDDQEDGIHGQSIRVRRDDFMLDPYASSTSPSRYQQQLPQDSRTERLSVGAEFDDLIFAIKVNEDEPEEMQEVPIQARSPTVRTMRLQDSPASRHHGSEEETSVDEDVFLGMKSVKIPEYQQPRQSSPNDSRVSARTLRLMDDDDEDEVDVDEIIQPLDISNDSVSQPRDKAMRRISIADTHL